MSEAVTVLNAYKKFGGSHLVMWRRQLEEPGSRYSEHLQEVVAVDHVSFRVQHSEIFGVVGPSGSGKSTLIRLLATLLQPDSGNLRVFGYDVVRQSQHVQRLTNRVSVEASFFRKLSPLDNLFYGTRRLAPNASALRQQAIDALLRLGLDESELDSPMNEMPRQTQQKVSLVRALLTRPRLLLLDEPTASLDSRSKREVHALLCEMRDTHGMTIFLATRDLVEASQLCDRIALMDGGRVVALDAPAEIKRILL